MLSILLTAAIIAILFIVIIAGRPDEFTVSRSVKVFAPPEKVFPHVNELRKWDTWSPWAKLDPDCKIVLSGRAAGIGASHAWSGNNKVGEGRMTITESRLNEMIGLKLEFLRPFKATNAAEFTFKSAGNQTEVVWSMSGKNNFFFKVFGLFMDCDNMVGKDFEKGLASLKTISEATGKN